MKLIDGDKLKEMLHTAAMPMTEYGRGVQTGYQYARAFIDNMPAIEAETVQHGRWVYDDVIGGMKYYRCTNCENHGDECLADENEIQWFKYCPHCGARMDATDTNNGKGGADNG